MLIVSYTFPTTVTRERDIHHEHNFITLNAPPPQSLAPPPQSLAPPPQSVHSPSDLSSAPSVLTPPLSP